MSDQVVILKISITKYNYRALAALAKCLKLCHAKWTSSFLSVSEIRFVALVRYQRSAKVVATKMDDDTVMMDIVHGKYYAIGGVGNLIWSALQEPQDIQSLQESVCDAYDVSEEDARADVEAFVKRLLDAGLVFLV